MIDTKEVARIVFAPDAPQPLVLITVGRFYPLLAFLHQAIYLDSARR